jgi:hypothetical protein
MITQDDFKAALQGARTKIAEIDELLATAACPTVVELVVPLRGLDKERIKVLLRNVPAGFAKDQADVDYIYVMQGDPEGPDVSAMASLLEAVRGGAKDYCRLNRGSAGTKTLYVGRSKKLRSRLSQHLGKDDGGTYAMHLGRWGVESPGKIRISYMKFSSADHLLVQAIEDGMWASLKPAFGRQGDK